LVETEEDKRLIKSADVDSASRDSDVVESYWLQKRRRFITSILTIEVKNGVAYVGYQQNNIEWDGKPEFRFGMPDEDIHVHKKENGKWVEQYYENGDPIIELQRGDLLCPCKFKIGDAPVLVVRECWMRSNGYPSHDYKYFEIEGYNQALEILDDVDEVRGKTFLVGAAIKSRGFRLKKDDNGEWFYYRADR
jgi:hypothetical protein